MKNRTAACALAAMAAAAGAAWGQAQYECTVVDAFITTYGLRETYIWDINDQGVACGLTTKADTLPGGSVSIGYAGFYWTQELGKTAYRDTGLYAINNLGQIASWGDLYQIGTGQSIPLPGIPGYYGAPYPVGINDLGVVTGTIKTCNCSNDVYRAAYIWDALNGPRVVPIPGARHGGRINNHNIMVGTIGVTDAFVYNVDTGAATILSEQEPVTTGRIEAADINDHNVVVGRRREYLDTMYQGYMWREGAGFTFLPMPGAGYVPDLSPQTVNDRSVVAGYMKTDAGEQRAFVWDEVGGLRDLNTVTSGIPDGFVLKRALRINEQGWIVGDGQGGGGFSKAFVLKPITAAACYADCNADGTLNLADFGCFQTRFALGNTEADCNGDSVLNLADFGCFQTKFALGCP